jgi:molybdenum ABC transporter ATP-binding protein
VSALSVRIRKALREFDLEIGFEVERGETLVIIGPSGCGKTTTLNLIAGLVTPDEGRITLGSEVLWDGAAGTEIPTEKRNIGYVFQDFALFPHMTVAANVAYGLRARRLARGDTPRRVNEVLDLLGIKHLRDRRPGALSGGERQRVALARAIACEAEILLLDEPLGSLDAQTRNRVRGELRQLLRAIGRIAVMVTHDYLEALTFGDKICVLDRGRVLQIGNRQELLRHPRSRFVAELTGVNFFEGKVTVEPDNGLAEIRVGDASLHVPSDGQDGGDTLVVFFPSDVTVSRRPPPTSAQNVIRGHVREIVHLGDRARLALNGALPICAEITGESLEELGLAEGDAVYASVKATAIKTYR